MYKIKVSEQTAAPLRARAPALLRALVWVAIICFASAAYADAIRVIHSFPRIGYQMNPVAVDSAGNVFGTTFDGGKNDVGMAYELVKGADGSYALSVLHSFETGVDGAYPLGGLIIDGQGNVFGTTREGLSQGSVFELSPTSNGQYRFRTLHAFSSLDDHHDNADGATPVGRLAVDQNGVVYGTTTSGGANEGGTVFSIVPGATPTFSTLYSFERYDGNSFLSLSIDGEGNLFGARYYGDTDLGDVFELERNGGNYTFRIAHAFSGTEGSDPFDQLAVDGSGNLYGAAFGGPGGRGVVFELERQNSGDFEFRALHNASDSDAATLRSTVVLDSSGDLLGTASADASESGDLVYRISPDEAASSPLVHAYDFPDKTYTLTIPFFRSSTGLLFLATSTDDSFHGTAFQLRGSQAVAIAAGGAGTEGNNPVDAILASGNDLFLESRQGGAWARGTILQLVGDGYAPVVLHAFAGGLFGDGAFPTGGLSADSAGNLYGTTESGGTADSGTVFELRKTADGYVFSVLYSFTGGADGSAPLGVVSDSAGHLFGIAQTGGSGGFGAVFVLSSAGGGFSLLHPFPSPGSTTPLAFDGGGNLFGTWGNTVFRISTSGAYSTLHTLSGSDGSSPLGRVAVDSGMVYGTASSTLFRVSTSGPDFQILRSLIGEDGQSPSGPVAFDASGSLLCATSRGGIPGVDFGTLVRMGKDGSNFAVLHRFAGAFDGDGPLGGLTREGSGRVVGTTVGGGELAGGVVFRIEDHPPALAISPSTLPDGEISALYPTTQFMVSGGTAPYRFGQSGNAHFVGVPPGLALTDGGLLSGIPYQEGVWSFAISVEDASGFVDSHPYTVTIGMGVTSIPPVATSSSVDVRSGVSTQIPLSGSDPTHAAPDFRFEIVGQPQFGALSDFSPNDGVLNYTPLAGFVGDDSFSFDTRDEFGVSAVATVQITVFIPSIVPMPAPSPAAISGRP